MKESRKSDVSIDIVVKGCFDHCQHLGREMDQESKLFGGGNASLYCKAFNEQPRDANVVDPKKVVRMIIPPTGGHPQFFDEGARQSREVELIPSDRIEKQSPSVANYSQCGGCPKYERGV